jgi:hypothetical protein
MRANALPIHPLHDLAVGADDAISGHQTCQAADRFRLHQTDRCRAIDAELRNETKRRDAPQVARDQESEVAHVRDGHGRETAADQSRRGQVHRVGGRVPPYHITEAGSWTHLDSRVSEAAPGRNTRGADRRIGSSVGCDWKG